MKMRLYLFALLIVNSISGYCWNDNHCNFTTAILNDTFIYEKHYKIPLNNGTYKDTSYFLTFNKNLLLKILECDSKESKFKIEYNYVNANGEGAEDEAPALNIDKDTILIDKSFFSLFDSFSIPNKYFAEIFKKINNLKDVVSIYIIGYNYDSSNNMFAVTYDFCDIFEVVRITSVYKLVNDSPVEFISTYFDKCNIVVFGEYLLLYNEYGIQLFDSIDYVYDQNKHEFRRKKERLINPLDPKSKLSIDGVLYIDKSKQQLIIKDKTSKYSTYIIQNGEFKKIK